MEPEKTQTTKTKTEQRRRGRDQVGKELKVEFNLEEEKDREQFGLLQALFQKINRQNLACPIRAQELLKAGITKLGDDDLKEIKARYLSRSDRLKIWADNYNTIHNTALSLEEFMVDVLPTIPAKNLKRYQQITL